MSRIHRFPTLTTTLTTTTTIKYSPCCVEDQWERRRKERAKDIISWTDPKAGLEEKKDFVWAPAR
jgi:hypothetical protein